MTLPHVRPEDTVEHAAQVMKKNLLKNIYIFDGDKPIGVVRAEDILFRVVARGGYPSRVNVREIMDTPPLAQPHTPLLELAKTMAKRRVSSILVRSDSGEPYTLIGGRYLNALASLDVDADKFFRAMASQPRLEILNILSKKPLTVDMIAEKVKLKPITVRHHLQILTETKLVREVQQNRTRPGRPAVFYGVSPDLIERHEAGPSRSKKGESKISGQKLGLV